MEFETKFCINFIEPILLIFAALIIGIFEFRAKFLFLVFSEIKNLTENPTRVISKNFAYRIRG